MICSDNQYDRDIQNLRGTFAVEGFDLSDETMAIIERIHNGDISWQEAVEELKKKHRGGDSE